MNLVLKTTLEPLEIREVKNYLRLDDVIDTSEDDYLLIIASREYCEGVQNRAYIMQVWQLSFDNWPSRVIELPKGNLQTVNLVTYKHSAGVVTTLTETQDYAASARGVSVRISPVAFLSGIWASIEPLSGREYYAAQQVNAEITHRIKIRYRAQTNQKCELNSTRLVTLTLSRW
ncbi:phage head closure protein [Desulfosporosinus sp. Sb-LF]|uniref:head-tail connector protein n=1 Tax=Desulfosporosinus sp. Sb-LF TaxID=2560027 RepID=UPI00107F0A38|nr:phage head closure protein [Desulfosporosinus sp. Sb-LF]TGE33172.1 hypothetical protein E4K68_06590 [Desulfosporosinus sp. Sb-LF]